MSGSPLLAVNRYFLRRATAAWDLISGGSLRGDGYLLCLENVEDRLGEVDGDVLTVAVELFDHGGGDSDIFRTEIDVFHGRVNELVDLGDVLLVIIIHIVP